MRLLLFLSIFFCFSISLFAQEDAWFFIRAHEESFELTFEEREGALHYVGTNESLAATLSNYKIKVFKKTYRNAVGPFLKRTFFVIADSDFLLEDLLLRHEELFEDGEHIHDEDKKIFEPNDYGLTSTIGTNEGFPLNLDYLDFIGAPKAWYYTTGNPEVLIGIADGEFDVEDPEFIGKSKRLRKSTKSAGHGYTSASLAAANGDNAYGIPGVCYDCGILATNFSDLRTYKNLLELSQNGAKVINCSYGTRTYYETGQEIINEIYNNGTILVAAGHNPNWVETKGEVYYYPASYDNVIAVSGVMHRYLEPKDNILYKDSDSPPYAENIRYHVGRTMGFEEKDITKKAYLYPAGVATLNTKIDILGPSVGLFLYADYQTKDSLNYTRFNQTSGIAPLVSGTVGLMFSLNPCLPHTEVESILKLTSTNIDHIEANKPYYGYYGAGALNTGEAVELVYNLYREENIAEIRDQHFDRWDFKLTTLSKELHLRDIVFEKEANLVLISKQAIVLKPGTKLSPNSDSKIHLKIDPELQAECDLQLRDPSIEE
ncbi:MAG TPA: S8 family serine peptidase [Flavobacteriaceae bacterium]|nr:S8 family serine peptidase [Flavobacteriaceae bacterium]